MLRQLSIRNLAVIASVELDFDLGMSVFTGETGTGKSILMVALGLILGDRADSHLIRAGERKAEVSAIIDITALTAVSERLAALEIKHEQELYLRRTVSSDGRSRAYINNVAVPIQCLRELTDALVDLHGQHAHQSLLRQQAQRKLVDDFGAHQAILAELHDVYQRWRDSTYRLKKQTDNSGLHQDGINLLQYQLDELKTLALTEDSYAKLTERHQSLACAHHVIHTTQSALTQISEGEGALLTRVAQLRGNLSELDAYADTIQTVDALLTDAAIQLDEAKDTLRTLRDTVEVDPAQLQQIEAKLEQYHSIARKHKLHPQALYAHQQTLSEKLVQLQEDSVSIQRWITARDEALGRYYTLAKELHEKRTQAAIKFAKMITEKMQEVGMPNGRFHIAITHDDASEPLSDGLDQVEFQVSTNPGQHVRPLQKVASGGELSRISLAIRIISTTDNAVPIMVFDEVDAGIGGNTALVVGKLLHRLATHRQLLCITHLPQVASFGQHHYRVDKTTREGQTYTDVCKLSKKDRIDEIARMLGGEKITEKSRRHAQEILNDQRDLGSTDSG